MVIKPQIEIFEIKPEPDVRNDSIVRKSKLNKVIAEPPSMKNLNKADTNSSPKII